MIESEAAAKEWLSSVLGADAAAIDRLERLVAMLVDENQRQNLVARASIAQVWQRHIVDSAQLLCVPRGTPPGGAWLDLGTGAGFPGLVIAALQPARDMLLVDSRRLRVEWLQRAARSLGLDRAHAVLAKVEDLPASAHAVISARAFAPLERLLSLSMRFSTPQTLWLLPKGAKARHELQELGKGWRHTFHVEQSLTDATAGVLVGNVLAAPQHMAQARTSALPATPSRKGAHR
jgi:16S rRNA (guanine527-N7)-methyltransferase